VPASTHTHTHTHAHTRTHTHAPTHARTHTHFPGSHQQEECRWSEGRVEEEVSCPHCGWTHLLPQPQCEL